MKTKETNPTRPGSPTPCKQALSNTTGTSFDNGKGRGKDLTRIPVLNLPLCHWSSQLFDLRVPSSTDVPALVIQASSRREMGYVFVVLNF